VTCRATALVVHITGADRLWALKGHLEIPLAHVVGAASAQDEAQSWLKRFSIEWLHRDTGRARRATCLRCPDGCAGRGRGEAHGRQVLARTPEGGVRRALVRVAANARSIMKRTDRHTGDEGNDCRGLEGAE